MSTLEIPSTLRKPSLFERTKPKTGKVIGGCALALFGGTVFLGGAAFVFKTGEAAPQLDACAGSLRDENPSTNVCGNEVVQTFGFTIPATLTQPEAQNLAQQIEDKADHNRDLEQNALLISFGAGALIGGVLSIGILRD